jgi:hypothetical protein
MEGSESGLIGTLTMMNMPLLVFGALLGVTLMIVRIEKEMHWSKPEYIPVWEVRERSS